MAATKDKRRAVGRNAEPDAIARSEALELIDEMREELRKLQAFLDTADVSLDSGQNLTKKVARLRLMSDDLASAAKFAAKLSKD